ncbi:agmatine deiminase family protein [Thermospira aquatica]|uniref:Agmatine deiminase family protein n=1 Tax=Thermospira aquatica TaxID=2828656 RepID=A0AAX3BDM1_9SPIR|nr:agmatine deiminase family protein [Thermospira aquatica]URA10423.1 agmatine deiminase family protein [Thermospira aquatica]
MNHRLPAEWERQDGILLAWPHEKSDWAPLLPEVEKTYTELVKAIARFERVLLVVPPEGTDTLRTRLGEAGVSEEKLMLVELPTNDTWARDFGFITVFDKKGRKKLLDFGFNAWGLKFAACEDNQVNRRLFSGRVFRKGISLVTIGLILEGGGIESDGEGTILTTTQCLLSPNRNPHLSKGEIERALKRYLGARRVLWLSHGYLAGDDTDSHIDTLARFVNPTTIVYVACDDPADEHYEELRLMKEELASFRTMKGKPYRLVPLPLPKACYDEEGNRLPATYANFLILNGAVIVPTYNDEENDPKVLQTFQALFPEREVVAIPALSLIKQHGSIHCVTMQIPEGVLV